MEHMDFYNAVEAQLRPLLGDVDYQISGDQMTISNGGDVITIRRAGAPKVEICRIMDDGAKLVDEHHRDQSGVVDNVLFFADEPESAVSAVTGLIKQTSEYSLRPGVSNAPAHLYQKGATDRAVEMKGRLVQMDYPGAEILPHSDNGSVIAVDGKHMAVVHWLERGNEMYVTKLSNVCVETPMGYFDYVPLGNRYAYTTSVANDIEGLKDILDQHQAHVGKLVAINRYPFEISTDLTESLSELSDERQL